MKIRRLPEGIANRIAAGEVVERPASVVKELAENAIDAGARQIDIAFRDGGCSLIRVSDDGEGMDHDELDLAVERHATSKLTDDDLVEIRTLGFRGEALPSIGAVSRLTLTSHARQAKDTWRIEVAGGRKTEPAPAPRIEGTTVEVRDLFYAVPARLKFLRSPRAETAEAADVVRRLALAAPEVGFSFTSEERVLIDLPPEAKDESRRRRIARVMGEEVFANLVDFEGGKEPFRLWGLASLPTYHRAQSGLQFFFVNGRPVRDKLLAGAIRGAYADLLMRGRFPAVCLFVECPSAFVDVNVHPAKAEVRFRDSGLVRGAIISGIREALGSGSRKTSAGLSAATLSAARPMMPQRSAALAATAFAGFAPQGMAEEQAHFAMDNVASARMAELPPVLEEALHPLGAARAQLHENYILAQTEDGIVIVDQHAAHERLVYEELKRERADKRIATQPLLIPDVIDLDAVSVERLALAAPLLAELGLVLEPFGAGAVVVREVPAALAGGSIRNLVRDVADDLSEDHNSTVEERVNHLLATMACHHSVRSGRQLRADEMNALLRKMEVTPNSGQCNHGRPTFIELKLSDIERLFGRS